MTRGVTGDKAMETRPMEAQCEVVHVVEDWYDGPRTGYADYQQHPHFYRSLHLEIDSGHNYNPDEDRFELTPVPEQVVEWAIASHQLWLRWDEARRAGTLPQEAHDEVRILREDRARNQQLRDMIEQHWAKRSVPSFIVRGEFHAGFGGGKVLWRELDEESAPYT